MNIKFPKKKQKQEKKLPENTSSGSEKPIRSYITVFVLGFAIILYLFVGH